MDLNQAILVLAIAGGAIGVGTVAWLLARLAAGMAGKTSGTFDDLLAKALRGPLAILAGLVTCAVGLVVFSQRLDDAVLALGRRVLVVLFVLAAAWGLLRIMHIALERTGQRRVRLRPATRVGERLLGLVVYTLAFLLVLSTFGISVTPLLTGLGIAGLAVALALQDTGANFFAGIWIQTGRSLQPGHYVRIEEKAGLEGYVEDVGWRVTRVRTLGGNTVVVPNNKLAQSIVTDFTLPDRQMAVSTRFRAAFEVDPDLVMRCLIEEARAVADDNPGMVTTEPFAQLADIGDDANHYDVTFKVSEFVQQFKAQQQLRLRVLRRFHAEKIRIPFPTRHNYQEPVKPQAERKPEGPGGFAAEGRRPPRPTAKRPPVEDPREAEAHRAKREIAAQQREKEGAEPAPALTE